MIFKLIIIYNIYNVFNEMAMCVFSVFFQPVLKRLDVSGMRMSLRMGDLAVY